MAGQIASAVALVNGRRLQFVDGAEFRQEALAHRRVLIDIGAGDGRFAYRLAVANPDTLVVAIDASAHGLREMSWRAGRKPARGGLPNIRCIRATAERPPEALNGLADAVYVLYPWGSLLRAVVVPDPVVLSNIARLGRDGAALHVVVNGSISDDAERRAALGLPPVEETDVEVRLVPAYAAAGIHLTK
jgi:16S rRNA (adenine(1408)-N(1))-methyltransferase